MLERTALRPQIKLDRDWSMPIIMLLMKSERRYQLPNTCSTLLIIYMYEVSGDDFFKHT